MRFSREGLPKRTSETKEKVSFIEGDPRYQEFRERAQSMHKSREERNRELRKTGIQGLEPLQGVDLLTLELFKKEYPGDYDTYMAKEKDRVYTIAEEDPLIKKLGFQRNLFEHENRFDFNSSDIDRRAMAVKKYREFERDLMRNFADKYPEKAIAYSQTLTIAPHDQEILKEILQEKQRQVVSEKETQPLTAEKSEKAPAAKVKKEKIELGGVVLPEPIMNIAPADVRQLVSEASKPGFYEASTPEKQKQIREAEGWVIQYNDQRSKWYQEYEKRPKDDFIGWLAGEHGIGQEAAAGIYKELAARTPEQIAENLASSYWLKRLIKERGDTAQYVGGKDFDIARSEAYLKNIKEGRFFDSAEIYGLSGGELTHATEKSAYNFFKGIADNTEKYIEMFKDSPELVEKGKRDGEEALRIIKAMERAMADRVKQFPNADKIIAADIKSGDLEIINKYQRQGEELFEKGVPAKLMTPEEKRVYYDAQSRRDGFVSWLIDQYGVEKSAATEIYKELAARSEKSPQESVVETPARKEKLVSQQEKERLIRQEKEKILQEKINKLFKEFDSLRVRDFESIFQTGKTAEGKMMKSKSMGRLNPETAKALAKAFREGIKLLPEIIKALPKLLKNLDKDLTKEASKRVEKKLEQEKKKAEKQPKKETKPAEIKPKEKMTTAEVKK